MNQRIQELYKQATTWALDNYPPPVNAFMWEDLRNKKFAELVVNECIAICISNALDDLDSDDRKGSSAKSAFEIKEHFGIEQ